MVGAMKPEDYQPGQNIDWSSPLEAKEFNSHRSSDLEPRVLYSMMVQTILPRPIAWVSTQSKSGVTNAAPFSFFNGVSSNPPCLVLSCAEDRDGSKKDTLINIEETKEFVVNLVQEEILGPMHHSSAAYAPDESEIEKLGLVTLPSTTITPPRLAHSKIHFECRLDQIVPIGSGGPGSAHLIIGRIECLHLARQVLNDQGQVDFEKLKPVARLGGADYLIKGKKTSMPRATLA